MATLNQFTLRRTSPRPSPLQPDPAPAPDTRRQPKVPLDVLVCTPDMASATTQRFLKSLKDTTSDIIYTLRIADNRRKRPFIHAIEVNKALDAAEKAGHNLLICDDDIVFEDPQWLHKALNHAEALDNDFGVMGFRLSYPNHGCWASGVFSDASGQIALIQTVFEAPTCVPVQCSCCWLIAPTDLRWDERYKKYRVELPFAYQLWERGKKFWTIPARIRHDCGTQFVATVTSGAERAAICVPDEKLYRDEWIKTGRESKVLDSIARWMADEILDHPKYRVHVRAKERRVVTQDKPERRALATVMVGKDSKRLLPLFRHAARRWNAELFVFDETWMTDEASPHFLKWKVNVLFGMGYTRVCLIDGTDAVILPSCPDLFDVVPVGMLGVYDEAPLMALGEPNQGIAPVDRRFTCERFVHSYRTVEPGFRYKYPGWYFNSGVLVFNQACNPFKPKFKVSFNTDTLFDQTALNVAATDMPICWLDATFNRMAIPQAHKHLGTSDMFANGAQILHYCGTVNEKRRMVEDLKSVLPPAVERLPGPSLDGIYDFWRWAGRTLGAINNAVEIGSAHGESAWAATEMHPDMKLTCVDPWESERYGDKAHSHFVARHGWNKNVTEIKGYSVEASGCFADGSLDVVYIDAMHEDPWVSQDIMKWLPKVRKGGIIGGHDYIYGVWPDVVRAVNAAFGGPDIVFQDTSWAVRIK